MQFSDFCKGKHCYSAETCSRDCRQTHPTEFMLFNHTVDPLEDENVAKQDAYFGVVQEMRAALQVHKRSRGPPFEDYYL